MAYAQAQSRLTMGAASRSVEVDDQLGNVVFRAALVLLFFHCSMAHELAVFYLGARLYPMYILIPLCIGGTLLGKGLSPMSQNRAAMCWIAFTVWGLVCVPFSVWPGGALEFMYHWIKGSVGTVLVYSGVLTNWKRMRTALYVIAASIVVNVFAGHAFTTRSYDNRLTLQFGTMGNANDFAAHLLFVIPVVLFIAFTPRWPLVVRLSALILAAATLQLVLSTGSRGATVAIGATALFYVIRAPMKQRMVFLLLAPVAALGLLAVIPESTRNRLFSFSEEASTEAGSRESRDARKELFWASIRHTLQNPILGVGPGQFPVAEGQAKLERGGQGMWFSTHNSFTQISSETGIPGILFFGTALVLTWRMLTRVWREAARRGMKEMSQAAFWLSISFVAYTTAAFFLNLGYMYHFPTLTGLAIGLQAAFEKETSLAQTVPAPSKAVMRRSPIIR